MYTPKSVSYMYVYVCMEATRRNTWNDYGESGKLYMCMHRFGSSGYNLNEVRREDTGWVSKFINILYIDHLILVNGNLLAVGHLHVCCLGS